MRHAPISCAVLALLVSACGSGAGGNNSTDSSGAVAAGSQTTAPDNAYADPTNSVVPVPMPRPTALGGIPPAFDGRWGMVADDCRPGRDQPKGLLVIRGDQLQAGGEGASASNVQRVAPDRVTADLHFRGDGERWRRGTALTLLDDGRTLVREEQQPANSYRYARCPG